MKRLELFKPLIELENDKTGIIFDDLCLKYSEHWKSKSDIRPFVIFYNEKENTYYYLKCRSAFKLKYDDIKERKTRVDLKPKKGEVFIESQYNNGLLRYDSYVDCSQIFKIDADLMDSLIDTKCQLYKETSVLRKYEISVILDKINKCCNEEPPYLSILEVKENENNEVYAESLYLCDQKLQNIEKLNELDIINFQSLDIKIHEFYSSNFDSTWERNRYNNAMEFKKMFQNEYFNEENLDDTFEQESSTGMKM